MANLFFTDIRKIASAVVFQAVADARAGQYGAVAWFSTKEAELFLTVLDLEPETVVAIARAGFPKMRNSHKPLKEIDYQICFNLD